MSANVTLHTLNISPAHHPQGTRGRVERRVCERGLGGNFSRRSTRRSTRRSRSLIRGIGRLAGGLASPPVPQPLRLRSRLWRSTRHGEAP
eukprot:6205291-Pleurochrysis_carterae.AAC.1